MDLCITLGPRLTLIQVRMLGKKFGSLELLKSGMHVKILYMQAGQHRVGNHLAQINESEET